MHKRRMARWDRLTSRMGYYVVLLDMGLMDPPSVVALINSKCLDIHFWRRMHPLGVLARFLNARWSATKLGRRLFSGIFEIVAVHPKTRYSSFLYKNSRVPSLGPESTLYVALSYLYV